MKLYESRLSYFNDKATINHCKPLSVHMAAPRGLVKTVIPVSLKPKRIRTLEYAFSLYQDYMPKISQIDEVPCQPEVRILQKITLNHFEEAINVTSFKFNFLSLYTNNYHH